MKVFFDEKFLQTIPAIPARPGVGLCFIGGKEKIPWLHQCPAAKRMCACAYFSYLEYTCRDEKVYPMALLAAGAAIGAAEASLKGGGFALCRPPGHHASPDSAWGFWLF